MGGNYSEDETMPINEKQDISEDYNIRSSVSSRGGIGASSVDGSDDSNPTPTSGQDDGYHTEGNVDLNNEEGNRFSACSLNLRAAESAPTEPSHKAHFKTRPLINSRKFYRLYKSLQRFPASWSVHNAACYGSSEQ